VAQVDMVDLLAVVAEVPVEVFTEYIPTIIHL